MLKSWNDVVLGCNAHRSPADGMCVMEAVSWFTGERFSEAPSCVPPILRQIMYVLNDHAPSTADRQLLKPLIPYLVNAPEVPMELYDTVKAPHSWAERFKLMEAWLTSASKAGELIEREVEVPIREEEHHDQASGVA